MEDDDSVACNETSYTDLPPNYASLETIVYPILLTSCTVGHGTVLYLWGGQFRKSSTNVYLTSMSVFSIIFMWLVLPSFLIPFLIPPTETDPSGMDSFTSFTVYFSGFRIWALDATQLTTDWILLVYSIERFIAITKPLFIYKWMKPQYAIYAVLIVFFLASLTTVEQAVYYYYYISVSANDLDTAFSDMRPDWLTTWYLVMMNAKIVISLGTFITLTTVNTGLIIALGRRSQQTRLLQAELSDTKTNKHSWTDGSSMGILVGCFVLYFASHIVGVFQIIFDIAASPPYCSFEFSGDDRVILFEIAKLLGYTDYSFKFLLYCTFSKKLVAVRKAVKIFSRKDESNSLSNTATVSIA